MLFLVLVELFIPACLLAVIALQRAPNPTQFILGVLAMGSGLFFMWLALPWDVTSIWIGRAIPFLFVLAVFMGYRRIGSSDKEAPPPWSLVLNAIISIALLIVFAGLSWQILLGYPAPEDTLRLSSPLKEGRYIVVQGGASPFINGHNRVTPQNHALDILGLNALGSRRMPFSDVADLNSYEIFGHPVFAPCRGKVLSTVDGLPDHVPGETDTRNLAGNHVLLLCGDVEVVLAHLRQGTVLVYSGQQVDENTQIGEVGNSGNTSEPHLHIHAERGGERGILLNGQAVPMLIDGRYLVRGDTL